jgi:hypothetical protein
VGLLVASSAVLTACGGSGSAPKAAPTTTAPSTATVPSTTTAVPAGGTTTVPTSATLSACLLSGLLVSSGSAGGAAGSYGQTILFTNRGGTTCTMLGYPGVAALNANGQQVAQATRNPTGMMGGLQSTTSPISVVTLAPGQTASAEVEASDIPVGTATSCVYYPALLVTPPGETHSVTVNVSVGISGIPGCVPIAVNPVVAGTSGRSN